MKTIIYIAGLYHSGSTVLERKLTFSSSIIGLGEIFKYLTDGPEDFCSCGSKSSECNFWSKINLKSYSRNKSKETLDKEYKYILDRVQEFDKNIEFIIDGSKCHPKSTISNYKNLKGLFFHSRNSAHNLKVIRLFRDPRSWVPSIVRREKRFKRKNLLYFIYFSFIGRCLRWAQWIIMNRLIDDFIYQNNLEFINISYEDLCLKTENTIARLNKFLNLDIPLEDKIPERANSHITVGNPSRLNPKIKNEISYDTRWIEGKPNLLDYLFTRIFFRYIKKKVYNS